MYQFSFLHGEINNQFISRRCKILKNVKQGKTVFNMCFDTYIFLSTFCFWAECFSVSFFRKTFPKRIVYSVMAIVLGAIVAARYGFYFIIKVNKMNLYIYRLRTEHLCFSSPLVLTWPSMWRVIPSSCSMMSSLLLVACTQRRNLASR